MNATRDGAALAGNHARLDVHRLRHWQDWRLHGHDCLHGERRPASRRSVLEILLILTIVIELGGGTAIVLGWKTPLAALLVFSFTMLVTLVFHRFWVAPPDDGQVQQLMFMKNESVMGGLLVLYAFGPGKYAFGPGKYAFEHRAVGHR